MHGFMSKLIALMAVKIRCVTARITQVISLSALVAAGLIWKKDLYAAVNHTWTATTPLLVPIWESCLLMHIVDSQISLFTLCFVCVYRVYRVSCVYIFGSLLILPVFRLLSFLTLELWVMITSTFKCFASSDDPWVVRCTPSLSRRHSLTDPLLTLKLSWLSMNSAFLSLVGSDYSLVHVLSLSVYYVSRHLHVFFPELNQILIGFLQV